MKSFFLLITVLLGGSFTSLAHAQTRTIYLNTDEIAQVRTALGIATKVLLNDNPTSAPIIGDLGAFRIEAIDKGYAVKPLRFGAKTNFFITTKDQSYIVKLTTVMQDQADYVAYLVSREKKMSSQAIQYKEYKKIKKENELILITRKIGKTDDSHLIIEFSLNSSSEQQAKFENFKVKQGKSYRTIQSLILSHKWMTPDKPISGWLTLNKADLSTGLPLTIEVQTKTPNRYLAFEIPKEVLWIR